MFWLIHTTFSMPNKGSVWYPVSVATPPICCHFNHSSTSICKTHLKQKNGPELNFFEGIRFAKVDLDLQKSTSSQSTLPRKIWSQVHFFIQVEFCMLPLSTLLSVTYTTSLYLYHVNLFYQHSRYFFLVHFLLTYFNDLNISNDVEKDLYFAKTLTSVLVKYFVIRQFYRILYLAN